MFVSLTPFIPEYDRAAFGKDVLTTLKDLADDICKTDSQSEPQDSDLAASSSNQSSSPPPAKRARVDPTENPFFHGQASSFQFAFRMAHG